jgi:FlaA1/EpsC-like NDP-sugar epimerase
MTAKLIRAWIVARRRAIADVIHVVLAAAALSAAFLLRFEFVLEPVYRQMLFASLALALPAKWFVFRCVGVPDLAWRYFGFTDLGRIVWANAAGSLAMVMLVRGFIGAVFPRSIFMVDFVLSVAFVGSIHAVARVYAERRRQGQKPFRGNKRILIYGAGKAGVTLAAEFRTHSELGMVPVGFVDDDPKKRELRLQGLRVLGPGADLVRIASRSGADEILLAIPAASGSQLTDVLERCQSAGIPTRRIPPLAELVQSKVLADQIRDVRLEDLLGRPPVTLEESALRQCLEGRVVLVTGAGGSIGAELCRQIARFDPAAVIGFDQSETALYEIEHEMRQAYPHLRFVAEIGSIQNRKRLDDVVALHGPQVLYHAAAYKHVPMMESHPFEAVENNIFGTRNVVLAAVAHGVGTFVLVSSDKAVRPANVMGATKRMAELICLAASQEYSSLLGPGPASTRFLAVRFGNVLGSNGSVIPLFRRQIAAGGPVTVTHPEMRRFFMTIPEAAQLVLQASAMGKGGEIFVLEMGEAVPIAELARKMVLLSGLRPEKDIRIEYSGIRPGEKLSEDLSLNEERTIQTSHRQIRLLAGPVTPSEALGREIDRLRLAVEARDAAGVILCLRNAIPEYNPSTLMLERAFSGRQQISERGEGSSCASEKVVAAAG